MPEIEIQTADPGRPEICRLIELLDEYQTGLYPIDSVNLMPIDVLRQPHVLFLTATVNGQLGGCGAVVNRAGEYAEIKRMYVLPEFRGLGLGRRLLQELEAHIRRAGVTELRLETGIYQLEALALYESAGYQRCGPFGVYRQDEWTLFLGKRLEA